MQDYQGNSKNQKPDEPKLPEKNLTKVVTGEVVVKPKGVGARFKSIFFGGDMSTAKQYVVAEVVFPALRNLAVEVVTTGMDRLVYGESGRRRRGPINTTSRISYNNPLIRQDPRLRGVLPNQNPTERWVRQSKPGDNVTVSSRSDAETVVENLTNVVEMYDIVSVADLNELLGLSSASVDYKWGWTNLASIQIRQVRDGWEISFPPVEEIQ